MQKEIQDVQKLARIHAPIFGYFILGIACVLGLWGIFLALPYVHIPSFTAAGEDDVALDSTHTLEASIPVRIRIPKISVDARFESPLGLGSNGEIEVPEAFDTVGWYKYGPTPGERGPAVVVGHVDSLHGPEVFYRLRTLSRGDRVEIDREDGSVVVFEVTRIMQTEQDSFPTEEVYGDIDHAGLRLVTCSGSFDRGTFRYSHNLIVFARLVETD